MSIKDPLTTELETELALLQERGRLLTLFPTGSRESGKIFVGGKTLLDFSSLDFFDFSNNPQLKRKTQESLGTQGNSAGSSRARGGTFASHIACEARLAKFLGKESSLLFSSRNQAMLSLLTTILTEQDVLLSPEDISSPASDAAYLVNAQVKNFDPTNPASLDQQLSLAASFRNRIVCLEGLNQLTGELSPLKDILAVARKHGAQLIIDESVAIGILGARGAGASEFFHMGPDVFCIVGDLSGALSAYGGFLAGSAVLCSSVLNRSRTFRHENAVPPYIAELAIHAIDQIELEHANRELLDSLAKKFKEGIGSVPQVEGVTGSSAIVAAHFAQARTAREFTEALFQKDVFVESFRMERSFHQGGVIRFLINKCLAVEDIDKALEACSQVSSVISN